MKKSVYICGTAMLLALSVPGHAQEAQGVQDDEAIIVTARRSEEKLQDVPISITVLSQSEIAKRNIYNAGDLGAYVPSLTTNANFGPQKSSFAIRGFIQEGRTSPSVGVYFADVVAPRANSGTTSGNGAGVGAFFDLQNVQVLKGPQGTLFGRNTTGGAILLVPTKPTGNLEGWVEGSMGNFDMKRVQAVLNAPLSDTFRIRLGVDRHKADGYLRNRSGVGPKRLGDTDYIAARLSIVADLTPDLENYTIFNYSRSDTAGIIPKVLSCPSSGTGLPDLAQFLRQYGCDQVARGQARGDGFWDVENSNPNAREYQETWQAINTTTWQASDTLTIKNIVSYAEFEERASFNLFGDNFVTPFGRIPTLTLESGSNGRYASQFTFTEEFQVQGRTEDNSLNWQAGAYLEISKPLTFNTAYNEIFIDCPNVQALQCSNPLGFGSIYSANIRSYFNNKGLYAQATYNVSERFSVTGGIRYTMDKSRDSSRHINGFLVSPGVANWACQNQILFPGVPASGPNDPVCNNVIKISSKKPTWLIDAEYKPNDDMMLYAKWTRGYRQGGIISVNIGLETTNPETVDTYEIGAKTTFRGAVPGYFNVAAFYNDFRDQQLAANPITAPQFNGIIPPSQAVVNAGKSRIWGIELDASVRPFEGLKIDAGYTYLNTKLIDFIPPVLPIYFSEIRPAAEVGDALSNSPKNRYTVTATYTLPLDESIGEISFGGTFTHTDANDVFPSISGPATYRLRASNLLNLNAGWESVLGSSFDLAFFMTNATNQKRMVYPTATLFTIGSEVGHLNMPRTWGVRVKYRFGE